MGKKARKTALNIGFSYWTFNDYLTECPNVVRWNPRLAIDWMDALASRCVTDIQINGYNYAAKRMNDYLDFYEKMRYYDKNEVWENDRVRRVEYLSLYEHADS